MDVIRFIEFNFAYQHRGSGTPMVLIHGFPLDGSIWNQVVPRLERQFELLIPDLRGFGMSTTNTKPPTMDIYARDIADMLDFFRFEKAVIAGHSMGGYVALAFANKYPDRVAGLGMISSQVLADPPDRKEGRYKTADNIAANGIQNVVDTMAPKFTPSKAIRTIARQVIARQHPIALIDALKAMAERKDFSALFASLQIPVAIVHGDADELIPIDRAREMKAALPNAHYTELKAVGHLPMLEAPQETARALLALGG